MWIWNSKLPGRPWVRALHSGVQQIFTRLLGTGGATPLVYVQLVAFIVEAQPTIAFIVDVQPTIAFTLLTQPQITWIVDE
jgi:hypothetical protein